MAKLLPTMAQIIAHNKERVRMAIIRAWEDDEEIEDLDLASRLGLEPEIMEEVLKSLEADKMIARATDIDVL